MLIYLAEAALYMSAKFDESGIAFSFSDFHEAILDLPSFGALLQKAGVKFDEIRWEHGMY